MNWKRYWFSNPNNLRAKTFRFQHGLGLAGPRGHDNFKIIDIDSDRMTLTIDDERKGPPPTWERGDEITLTAEKTETKTTSTK